jgi:nitrate reductase / nitrite oxidoreductase, alpha subunit
MSPVEAWKAIQNDPEARASYTRKRGLGGFVRATWDEVTEITAAANAYTAKKYGPDRVFGFSPIPAMSMVSYAPARATCRCWAAPACLLRLVLRPAARLAA